MVLVAEHVEGAGEAGERAGDPHRADEVLLDPDPAVGGGVGVEPDGSHLVPEGRAVEDEPEHDECDQRDEEADVQPLQFLLSPEDGQPSACSDVVRDRHGLVRRVLQRSAVAEEPLAHPDRDPVEHDRRDHLVRAHRRLQEAGDTRPRSARERRGPDRQHDVRQRAHRCELVADPVRDVEADEVLALAADVEHPAAEGEGDGEPGQDQGRRLQERLREVVRGCVDEVGRRVEEPVQAGAVEDVAVREQRVVAGRERRPCRRSGTRAAP